MLSASDLKYLHTARRSLGIARLLLIPLFLIMLVALYAAFLYAPTERQMGDVQRIFYFHVGAAWNSFLAFFMVFLGGLIYLMTRKEVWDHVAAASAEIGVFFTTIVLATGSLWARPIWGTWWPWGDPRVTTVLVLWLIYVAYLILRSSLPEGDKKYKFCAVFGIIGFIDVPIVYMSIRWWRTIHPVVITAKGFNLDPKMVTALMISLGTFTVLYSHLILLRLAARLHSSVVDELSQQVLGERGPQA